jgi:N4-gp56 family major capsid protein
MAIDTTTTLSDEAKTFYNRLLLERLLAYCPHLMFADPGRRIVIPGKAGYSLEWRKFAALSAATTALTQGVTPTGSSASVSAISATPAQYGDYITYSDVLDMVAIDPILVEYVKMLAEQAGLTLDSVARDVLNAGTTVQYAGAVANRAAVAAANKLSTTEIDKAVRTLEIANVPKIMDEFGGSYIMLIHPNTKYDLRADSGWKTPDQYAGGNKLYSGEDGRWNGVRILRSTNAKVFEGQGDSGIDVYASLVMGAHYFGTGKWEDNTGGQKMMSGAPGSSEVVEFFVKPLGSAGSSDPLNQRGTVGWKVSNIVKRLNESCAVRIEHSVS